MCGYLHRITQHSTPAKPLCTHARVHTRTQNEDKRQTDRQAMFPTVGYLFPEGYSQLPAVASNEELEVCLCVCVRARACICAFIES